MQLEGTLERFFGAVAPLASGDTILVAFSGGADSTALLLALGRFGATRDIALAAAHIDHGLDAGSGARATAAQSAASGLGVPLTISRQQVTAERGESLESAARRVRYRELERIARDLDARYIATAHHRDDQAETVLLRLQAGHGVAALSGIPARRGRILRPVLECSRRELSEFVRAHGLAWTEDPTNANLSTPRNLIRHRILPHLEAAAPGLSARLADLARASSGANTSLSKALDGWLEPRLEGRTVRVSRSTLAGSPDGLLPWAVTHLLRRCGATRRPSAGALAHLQRLLESNQRVAADLGDRWRIEDLASPELEVRRAPKEPGPFAYNLEVPGEVRLDELSSWFRLRAGRSEPWMFRGAPWRAGLSLPSTVGQLIVRNRRPGDRVQPLGCPHRRKLKDLLIDNRIPRHDRDRLPLLCHSDRILWVPGVTIDHEARIKEDSNVWVAEVIGDE